jgi:hypothetical protein
MNSNSCGKGLVIFSLTLVLSVGIASLFSLETEITELPKTNITKQEVLVNPKDKKLCVKEYENIELVDWNVDTSFLIVKLEELQKKRVENKEVKPYSGELEKEIEEVEKKLSKYGISKQIRNYDLKSQNLLYTENCYDNEF